MSLPAPVLPLLQVQNLRVTLNTPRGPAQALRGLDFSLARGGTLGLIGESGCGKSLTALALMGLLPEGAQVSGSVRLDGQELLGMDEDAWCGWRGNRLAMVFQEPMTALNPLHTIGAQIAEPLRLHRRLSASAARAQALRLMERVQLPQAARRLDAYPHQLSGGQRQRVVIAIALACGPQLLIADEPTTALDVTIQAQILDLMGELKERLGMAVMLITHAMGVVAETAQRVVVMYAGKVVEEASVEQLFARPRHPYTQGLIRSIPRIDTAATHKVRLEAIAGTVPKLIAPPEGCRFASRCKFVMPACTVATPPLREVAPGHKVACILEAAAA